MALKTTDLDLGNFTASGVFTKNIQKGVIAKIVDEAPERLLVGKTDVITLTKTPKAELVGEGVEKSPTGRTPTKRTVRTYKVQYTERMTDEVMIYDEDAQQGIVDAYVGQLLTALSRAVDLVGFHGINPLTGVVSAQATHYVDQGATRVSDADAGEALEAAVDALNAQGYTPTGIALDPSFLGGLRKLRNADGNKRFPEIGLGIELDQFEGLRAGVSNTVSAIEETGTGTPTNDLAILGDFDAMKFSVVRTVPVKVIEFGDPDGLGDLQRQNEVALRGEIYFAVATLDDDAFVVIAKDGTIAESV